MDSLKTEDRFLRFVSIPLSVIKDKGIYEGTRFYEWIKEKLLTNLQNARMYIEQEKFEQTIDIATLGVRTTEFNLSDERKDELYESGREAANEFLNKLEPR